MASALRGSFARRFTSGPCQNNILPAKSMVIVFLVTELPTCSDSKEALFFPAEKHDRPKIHSGQDGRPARMKFPDFSTIDSATLRASRFVLLHGGVAVVRKPRSSLTAPMLACSAFSARTAYVHA
jgi:hypothetical protein